MKNLENLKEKMVFKNYKELCDFLQEDIKNGKSKKIQIQEWERYFSILRDKQKYVVDEIYETPIPKAKSKKIGSIPNSIYIKNKQHIYFDNYSNNRNKHGVYKIVYDNHIYIGSTINSFKRRLNCHLKKNNLSITYNMFFKHNAKLYMLEDMTGCGEKEIRDREQFYIKKYSNDKNWICENIRLNTNVGRTYYKNKYGVSKKEHKPKYVNIKISLSDYKKATSILNENKIKIKEK